MCHMSSNSVMGLQVQQNKYTYSTGLLMEIGFSLNHIIVRILLIIEITYNANACIQQVHQLKNLL